MFAQKARRFIKEPGHADTYVGLKVNFIPHHNPDLVFFNQHGEEMERLDLGRYTTQQSLGTVEKGRTLPGSWHEQVRRFVLGEGNADSYVGLRLNFVPHHPPVFYLLDENGKDTESMLGDIMVGEQNDVTDGELTILWSSRYFSRLWCCFEVAAFLRKSETKKKQRVVVLPAATAGFQLVMIVGAVVFVVAVQFSWWAASVGLRPPQSATIVGNTADIPLALFSIFCICVLEYLLLGVWAEIQDINRQLHEFSVKDSDCFCCTNHHQHPETCQTLLCDRALVFDALKWWYAKGEEEEHLEKFDREVQTTLGQQIRTQLAVNMMMPRSTMLFLSCGIFSPYLCDSVTWMKNLWLLQSTEPMLKIWRCVAAVTRFYFLAIITIFIMLLIVTTVMVKLGFLLMVKPGFAWTFW
eukprot:s2225_g9.t1